MTGKVDDHGRALLAVNVLASRGVFPLFGVALLAGHVLIVDYEKCTVELH